MALPLTPPLQPDVSATHVTHLAFFSHKDIFVAASRVDDSVIKYTL